MSRNASTLRHLNLYPLQLNPQRTPYPTVFFLGKRNTGKTSLCSYVASQFQHIEKWVAICGTKKTETYWKRKFGSAATVKSANRAGLAYLERIIEENQRTTYVYREVLHEPVPNHVAVGIILDDCSSEPLFAKSAVLSNLFCNGRHYNTPVFVTAQYSKHLPPAIRGNTDILIVTQASKRVLRQVYDEFLDDVDDFNMFCQLAIKIFEIKPYTAMVYDNTQMSRTWGDKFRFLYCPDGFDPDSIQLGSPEWRAYNQKHYRDVYHEQAVSAFKKKLRSKRMEQYRAHRMVELDDFSDLDDEEETVEGFTLVPHQNKGTRTQVFVRHQTPEVLPVS